MEQKGFTLWFTGLSGAGKTTISKIIEKELYNRNLRVEVLDGDVVRTNLSQDEPGCTSSAGTSSILTASLLEATIRCWESRMIRPPTSVSSALSNMSRSVTRASPETEV